MSSKSNEERSGSSKPESEQKESQEESQEEGSGESEGESEGESGESRSEGGSGPDSGDRRSSDKESESPRPSSEGGSREGGSDEGSHEGSGEEGSGGEHDGESEEEEEEEFPEDASELKKWFMSLPEPVDSAQLHAIIPELRANQELTPLISDPYLRGLQENITALSNHVQKIQTEETEELTQFVVKLNELGGGGGERDAAKLERDFKERLRKIRRNREEYRGLMFDAIQERNNLIRALDLARLQQQVMKQKLALSSPERGIDSFFFFMVIFQVALIICYLVFMSFERLPDAQPGVTGPSYPYRADNFYTYYANIAMLVLVGLGLLICSARKYMWSALAYNFLLVAFAVQLTLLIKGFFNWARDERFERIYLNLNNIINAMYCAAACSISYGAYVGLVGLEGLFLVVTIEVIAWVLNWYVVIGALDMVDPGGGVHIHMFGGIFGVAASLGLANAFSVKDRYAELKTSYLSEIFSVVGALIVFIMIPGFNAALAPADTQGRAMINTIFGVLCSAILTFAVTHWRNWRKGYRMNMIDVSNGIFIGGIAVASAHNLIGGAFMGTLNAFVVVPLCFFFIYFLKPAFSRSAFFNDVRDVMWRHAVPGLFAGIAGVVALNVYVGQRRGGVNYVDLFRNGNNQASRNIYGVCVTLGISLAAGLIAGGIVGGLRSSRRIKKPVHPFTEEGYAGFAFDYLK